MTRIRRRLPATQLVWWLAASTADLTATHAGSRSDGVDCHHHIAIIHITSSSMIVMDGSSLHPPLPYPIAVVRLGQDWATLMGGTGRARGARACLDQVAGAVHVATSGT